MRTLLHLLTRPADPLVTDLIARQKAIPGVEVETVDLTQPDPDYEALVGKIFTADSVAVW